MFSLSGPLRKVHQVTQRRGKKETELARRRKGGIKRRETDPAITSSLSVLEAMAPHSSTLAWKIPWTEEACRLQSMGLLEVGHD